LLADQPDNNDDHQYNANHVTNGTTGFVGICQDHFVPFGFILINGGSVVGFEFRLQVRRGAKNEISKSRHFEGIFDNPRS
jgi:hypothetical protein